MKRKESLLSFFDRVPQLYKILYMTEGYCVKCRAKREMENEKEVSMKGKGGPRRAMTGTCPKCGTKMFRILGKKK